ncbi:MAG: hypothetical protein VKK63_00215 [Synechococcus sp.]|nr:hypothetical protein [Synechococcus sp.]
MDLAKLVGGSGIIKYRGLEMESKEGINVVTELEAEDISIDGISAQADRRVSIQKITINVVPSGKWINPDRLFPYLNMPAGRFVLPVLRATINASTDVITSVKHGFYTGDRVMFGVRAGGELPASSPQVNTQDWYYVSVIDADTYKLHATRAAALSGSSPIGFTTAGTDVVIIAQYDLEIIGEDGDRITFHAAAVTTQPNLILSRMETPFDEVEFTAYLRNGKRTTDDNAFYTIDSPGFSGWTANVEDIPTNSPFVAWADQFKVASVSVGDESITTSSAHGLSDGDVVYIGSTGTLPTATPALNPDSPYYVNVIDTDSVTLHTTAAAATAGTDAINFTSEGNGTMFLTIDNPPYTLMETLEGVEIESEAEIEDKITDRDGVVNGRFASCTMQATFAPLSLDTNNIMGMLKLQGAGAEIGRSMASNSKPLNIFSSGVFIRINGASPISSEIGWNMVEDRAKELVMVNTRSVVNGVLQDVGYVGTQIPA